MMGGWVEAALEGGLVVAVVVVCVVVVVLLSAFVLVRVCDLCRLPRGFRGGECRTLPPPASVLSSMFLSTFRAMLWCAK